MASLTEINITERELLKKTLTYLKLTQKELSEQLNLNPSWLSQVINDKITNASEENLKAISDFLVERAKDFRSEGRLTDDQIYEVVGFLHRFSNSAKDLIPKKIFSPEGIIPPSAKNYIERDYDKELLNVFKDFPFTIAVSGPIQTGKSSLLANVENTAKEKNIQTLWFDPKQAIPHSHNIKHPADVNEFLAKSLASQLQREWKLSPPSSGETPIDTLANLINWIKFSLKPTNHKMRLIIIDDLGRLGMTIVDKWVKDFVRDLHNDRGRSKATASLSIAIGVNYGYNSGSNTASLLRSSFEYWTNQILIKWFTENEVKELTKRMEVSLPKGTNLYGLFGGQPYLTNIALCDKNFLKSNIEWKNEYNNPTSKNFEQKKKELEPFAQRIREFQAYELLLNTIRRTILGPVWDNPEENKKVLKNLHSRYNDKNFEERKDYKPFLVEAKFLNEDNTPTIEIYRLIVEDLIEEIDGETNR